MKIFHYEIFDADKALGIDLAGNISSETLNSNTVNLAVEAEIVSVFVNSIVTAEIIDSLPNLKLLVTRSTGFDHIDTAYAKGKNIAVCNIPSYGSRTVAEFTFALILGLSRKTFVAIDQIKEKNDWNITEFEGFNLQGRTLGVVGTGRIGQNVIKIANGFEMKVIAFDAFPNADKAKELGFTYCSTLSELLNKSDIVTLHTPATKDTYHLINEENINEFKKGALLINTARGDLIDSEAIIASLNNNRLGGVGLDVLEGEHELKEEAEFMLNDHPAYEKLKSLLDSHVLINHPKVIVTPHIAFNAIEARKEIIETTIHNIQTFIDGKPQNLVGN